MKNIPVFKVVIPEYSIPQISKPDEKVNYNFSPKFSYNIPREYLDKQPDFTKIGGVIDAYLKEYFLGKTIAIRVLSSNDHKGKTIDELIEIIKKLGYDRYDFNRLGDRYDNIDNKQIDFFALDFKVNIDDCYLEKLLEPMYFWPLSNDEKPMKVDIVIVYDVECLDMVEHHYLGREDEIKRDGFVFKDQNNKAQSILSIIKIV